VKAAAKAPVKEKRRSVLGDVSNVNSQEDKDTKKKKQIKAVKPQPKLQGKTRKKLSEPKAVTAAVVEKVVALKPSKTIAVKKVKKAPEPTQRRTRSSDQNTQVLKKLKTQEYDDLDQDDFEDPMMVSEYVTEIFEYLRELEVATMPNENYMDQQKELQWKMRSILVDWLIEVHVKFRLLPETLYLAVNIIDR
jgi:G2/mitotic-specific cyclin 1/2